jgi:2-aminoethylphosphonate-pyruvate transaminase
MCKARSLSLDLYDQWIVMEAEQGKWRYTSPTHTVRAFYQALLELEDEGGVEQRYARYRDNQILLVESMKRIGLSPYLPILCSLLLLQHLTIPLGTDLRSSRSINF